MAADGKRKTTGALGVVLALALTVVVAGGAAYGAYAAASAQPGPAGETAAAAAHDTTLSVFAAPAVQTGEAPSPAPIPSEDAAENGYNYKEVLYDEDGLLVARIVGKRWSGYIAVIDDPMRVQVSVCPVFSPDMRGYSVAEHAENSGAVLAIANAKHDKKATDVHAEHAEEKAWAEAERAAEGALRAEEDGATREILEERGDYVGRVEDDGKSK